MPVRCRMDMQKIAWKQWLLFAIFLVYNIKLSDNCKISNMIYNLSEAKSENSDFICNGHEDGECIYQWLEIIDTEYISSHEDIVLLIGEEELVQEVVVALSLQKLSLTDFIKEDSDNAQVLYKYSEIYKDANEKKYLVYPTLDERRDIGSEIISTYLTKKVMDNVVNLKIIICARWYDKMNDFPDRIESFVCRISETGGRLSTNIGFIVSTNVEKEWRQPAFENDIRIIASHLNEEVGQALSQSAGEGMLPHYIVEHPIDSEDVIKDWLENSVPYNKKAVDGNIKFGESISNKGDVFFDLKNNIHRNFISHMEEFVEKLIELYQKEEEMLDVSRTVDIFEYAYALNTSLSEVNEVIDSLKNDVIPDNVDQKLKYTTNKLNLTSIMLEINVLQDHLDFLKDLNDSLSEPEKSQKNLHKILEDLQDTSYWYIALHTLLIESNKYKQDEITLEESFENLRKKIDSNEHNRNIKEKALQTVKEATINAEWTWECISVKGKYGLEIRGHFVRVSDFIYLPPPCNDVIYFLAFYASEMIFIDADIDLPGSEMQITMIAPTWQVLGPRSIILDGNSAIPLESIRAKKGSTLGVKNGADGMAGLPGSPGGSFYGVVKTIINLKHLLISVNGGNGGAGQHGGDGADFKFENAGGTGGNGGVGGKGGRKGDLKLFYLGSDEKKPLIETEESNGTNGLDGLGGQGGLGFPSKSKILTRSQSGITGNSSYCLEMPKESTSTRTFPHALNRYKSFFLSKMNSNGQNDNLTEFYELIARHGDIHSTYDLKELLDEYTNLELEYFRMNGNISMDFFFQNLNSRILKYGKSGSTTSAEKQIFRLVQGKIHRGRYSVSQIVDFKEYLEVELERIKKAATAYAIKSVREESVSAMEEIDANADEIRHLISNNLKNQIKEVSQNLDEDINSLLIDIITLRTSKQAKKRNLEVYRDNLETAMKYKTALTFLSIFGTLISCFGPVSAVIGMTISASSLIGQQFVKTPEYEDKPPKIPRSLTTLVTDGYKNLEGYQNAQQRKVQEGFQILIDAKKEAEQGNRAEEVEAIGMTITKLQSIVQENTATKPMDKTEVKVKKLKTSIHPRILFKKLTAALREQRSIYKKLMNNVSGKIFNVAENFFFLAAQGCDALGIFAGTKNEIEGVENEIKNVSTEIKDLQKLEDGMYDILIPIVEKLQASLASVANGAENTLTIGSLQLRKWDTIQELGEVSDLFQKFSEGFETEKLIKRTLDRMKKILEFLFELQKNLQELKPEPKAKVNNKNAVAEYFNTETDDTYLSLSFATYLYVTDSVNLMSSYQNIMYTFKQFIFPFVVKYMPSVYFQSHETDLHSQTTLSEQVVFDLKIFFSQSFEQNGGFLNSMSRSFTSENYEPYPFHIWKNSGHQETIVRLLSGEEVILYANISEHTEFQAVKFKTINVRFTSKEKSVKNEIQQILQKYNYQIEFTHSGMSLNRCNNMVYAVETGAFTYMTEFRKTSSKKKSRKGRSIDEGQLKHLPRDRPKYSLPEFNRNDLKNTKLRYSIYSPYTDWKIKLTSSKDRTLSKIKKFANKVDIMLVGEGQYSSHLSESICEDTELEDYYGKPVNPLP